MSTCGSVMVEWQMVHIDSLHHDICTILLGRSCPEKGTPQGSLRCGFLKLKINTDVAKDLPLPCPFDPKFCIDSRQC